MIIAMQPQDRPGGGARELASEGRFDIGPMPPGFYRLFLMDSSRLPVPIRRLLVDGAPAKSQLIEVTKSVRLDVTATLEGGGVSGYVYRGDTPVPGALAVLAPREASDSPFDYRGFQTDSDASFEFLNLPPGDYVLIAVEDLEGFEYANPAVVRPRLASGKPVRVEKGKNQTIRLELESAAAPAAPGSRP
jgi:hypothetical protein